jgi:hypothetical protein
MFVCNERTGVVESSLPPGNEFFKNKKSLSIPAGGNPGTDCLLSLCDISGFARLWMVAKKNKLSKIPVVICSMRYAKPSLRASRLLIVRISSLSALEA